MTVECECGEQMHFHASQVADLAPTAVLISTCHGCKKQLVFEAGLLDRLFAQLRKEGWIK